ncbi:VirD2 components [alpha proteobacterium U9-1i]|nr:VirD2 components [alpha proteobacterium U9-1i]
MSQPPTSNERFRASKLLRGALGKDVITPGSRLRISRPLDAESLIGRHEGVARAKSGASSSSLSASLQKRIGSSRALAKALARKRAPHTAFTFDGRQRAVVKLHYFAHAKGGGAALKAHARYIARDSASRGEEISYSKAETERDGAQARGEDDRRQSPRLEHSVFYDGARDSVSGARLAGHWAESDKRHFRIILSAENGGRIGDLRAYTREVMDRAEVTLGTRLEWFAVDHFDTDNPHTHIVLRGVRDDGRDLVIPREFVQHGFRNAARDAATSRLGQRTRDDARKALQREALAHAPTRLDTLIASQLDERQTIRLAELRAPNGSPDMTDALKARARELKNLGLAQEVRRNILRFEPGWRDALKAMELHLDIRKSLMQARAQNAARTLANPTRMPAPKELRLPFGLGF